MAVRVDLTLDCANPTRLAEFWKLALGYGDEPPPAPFATRQEWLQQFDLAEDDTDDAAWLHDPAGIGPRLSLLQVPEPKVAKNRLTWTCGWPGRAAPASDGPGSPRRSIGRPRPARPRSGSFPATTW
jgi:hypothetical protein